MSVVSRREDWFRLGEIPGWGSVPLLVAALGVTLGIGWIAVGLTGFELAPLAFPLALLAGFCVLHNERIWIFGAVAGQALQTIGGGRGIAVGDVLFGVWVLGGLMIWFAKELLVHRRTILRTGFDLLFLTFFVLSTIVAAVAHYIHGGILQKFFTEWAVMCNMLLYFPLRKTLRGPEDVKKLLIIFAGIALINGVVNVMTYRERLVQAVLETDIEGARSAVNETMSVALLILSTTVFAYARRMRIAVLGLAGMGASLVFLLITFSRGPIISGILAVLLMAPLAPSGVRKKLVVAYAGTLLLGTGLMLLVFPTVARDVGQSLVGRLGTLGSARTDYSVQSRLIEINALLSDVERSPMIGYGYGVEYSFFDKVRRRTITTTFLHNGWIWPFFKFGVPVALVFIAVMFYPFVRLLLNTPRRTTDMQLNGISVGTVCYLFSYFLTTVTSNQFSDFAGSACVFICWALLDYVNRNVTEINESAGHAALPAVAGRIGS